MIKLHVQDGHQQIETSGELMTVAAEMGIAISLIYDALAEKDAKAAQTFKELMQNVTRDDSPAWKGEQNKNAINWNDILGKL